MAYLLDTNVAIHLRDGDEDIVGRIAMLSGPAMLSLASLIELKGGLTGELQDRRAAGLARIVSRYPVLPLDQLVVEQYGQLVRDLGFAGTRVFDRLIAATALVHDLTLVTINGPDFRDIPDLKLEVWPTPAQ